MSTAVCAAAFTMTSGRTLRTVSARVPSVAEITAQRRRIVAIEGSEFTQGRERSLQLPADLPVLAQQQDLQCEALVP